LEIKDKTPEEKAEYDFCVWWEKYGIYIPELSFVSRHEARLIWMYACGLIKDH
jgi:hypothetical protein